MSALGFQLYSARNFQPFADIFPRLKQAGYTHVEGYGANYADADQNALQTLKADLDRNGLTMPTGHFSIEMLEQQPQQVLSIARILGMEAIYCPYLMPDQRPTEAAGWRAFGERLEKAGKPITDAGLTFGWHNHDFEFVALADGSTPQDQIFAGGPSLTWEADIAWIIRGLANPFDWIERYGKRITAVHVKDIAAAGENEDEDGWADVGHGTVEWKALVPALRKLGVRHFIVEHDNPKDIDRLINRSAASFKSF
ncbi:sugar phosphate isomerase/epimerase family protein [Allorhizobium undicola]|uniref:sugar phosphate isomerase/epimerase family protein n=1 Tax=Allorhizobium undicola TaxID=78527 RepID=UPI00048082C8|nr:sugar phosphate isomerase/epimerase [Allorhizobium undicola]